MLLSKGFSGAVSSAIIAYGASACAATPYSAPTYRENPISATQNNCNIVKEAFAQTSWPFLKTLDQACHIIEDANIFSNELVVATFNELKQLDISASDAIVNPEQVSFRSRFAILGHLYARDLDRLTQEYDRLENGNKLDNNGAINEFTAFLLADNIPHSYGSVYDIAKHLTELSKDDTAAPLNGAADMNPEQ